MAFFNRFKKQKPEMDDCEHLSALGDDPDAWISLDDDELKQVLSVNFIKYGATQDGSRIAGLFALYRYSMQRLKVDERRAMLTEFIEMIEQHEGLGHMGLMMFLAADTDPGIRSSAAPRFVIRTLAHHDGGGRDKVLSWAASCCWATNGSCCCWRKCGTNCPRMLSSK